MLAVALARREWKGAAGGSLVVVLLLLLIGLTKSMCNDVTRVRKKEEEEVKERDERGRYLGVPIKVETIQVQRDKMADVELLQRKAPFPSFLGMAHIHPRLLPGKKRIENTRSAYSHKRITGVEEEKREVLGIGGTCEEEAALHAFYSNI
ncbi:hypothetical protein M0804_002517 [Polistes exclamans]|nr:hypothetical protein M0804_002517 [Polistes exclamans]